MTTIRTTTEQQLREWIAAGWTHGEIAEELGCARPSVAVTCCVLGIPSSRGIRRGQRTDAPAQLGVNLPANGAWWGAAHGH